MNAMNAQTSKPFKAREEGDDMRPDFCYYGHTMHIPMTHELPGIHLICLNIGLWWWFKCVISVYYSYLSVIIHLLQHICFMRDAEQKKFFLTMTEKCGALCHHLSLQL